MFDFIFLRSSFQAKIPCCCNAENTMLEVLVNSENTMLKVLVNEKVIIQEGKTGDMQLSNVGMPILYNPSLV